MSPYELRPLSLGELLDRAFVIYRRNFWLFAGIMLIPAAVSLPFQFYVIQSRGIPYPWGPPAANSHALFYIYAFSLAYWFLYAIVQAATTHAVADVYLGRPSTVRNAYERVRGSYWRVIGVMLNVGIRTVGWICLFCIPAGIAAAVVGVVVLKPQSAPSATAFTGVTMVVIVLALAVAFLFCARYAVSIPALLLENAKGNAAIRRSIELSRGRRLQVFVSILLCILIAYVFAFLFQGPFYASFALLKMKGQLPVWLALALTTSGVVGGIIAGPLTMIVLVLLYYDMRIRKEAFDLQQMMASLPDSRPAANASPA